MLLFFSCKSVSVLVYYGQVLYRKSTSTHDHCALNVSLVALCMLTGEIHTENREVVVVLSIVLRLRATELTIVL